MIVRFSPRARRRVKVVATWWRENRPHAPTLFDEELHAAIEKLRDAPNLGAVYEVVEGDVVRRLLLPRTAQHLYYGVDAGLGVVLIHSVWGARRGRGPRL